MAGDLARWPGSVAAGVQVIETFGWDGRRFVRVLAHMDRMARTCAALGYPFEVGEVLVRLDALTPERPARVRVTVARDGAVTVAAMPVEPVPQGTVWRVMLAQEPVSSGDPWLRVKTTERGLYDRVRADLPAGVQEAVFANERGELCEGTVTSVFFDAGAGLCTPPLSCGLLPGILRAEMLAQGCREAVLPVADLERVALWVGNSLRGLIRAQLVGLGGEMEG